MVDRHNILKTAVDEIQSLEDLRPCLEVQFYGESAVDLGGPRKEFFALVLREVKKMYFNPVKEWTPSSYEAVGKILALSLLQNGKLPRVFSSDIVEEFTSPNAREFIQELRKGLDALGLCQMMSTFPQLLHLFTVNDTQNFLTLKRLTSLLKADFTVDGSNQRQTEGKIYSAFIKYLREVAGGRRGDVSLCSILKFATGSEEEPVLGFHIHPSIAFVKNASLVPTSNTCINKLNLPIPHGNMEVPSQDILFNLYDYAFCNAYFGLQ